MSEVFCASTDLQAVNHSSKKTLNSCFLFFFPRAALQHLNDVPPSAWKLWKLRVQFLQTQCSIAALCHTRVKHSRDQRENLRLLCCFTTWTDETKWDVDSNREAWGISDFLYPTGEFSTIRNRPDGEEKHFAFTTTNRKLQPRFNACFFLFNCFTHDLNFAKRWKFFRMPLPVTPTSANSAMISFRNVGHEIDDGVHQFWPLHLEF